MADHVRLAVLLACVSTACSHLGAGRPPEPQTLDPALLSPDARIEQSLALSFSGRDLLARSVVVKQGSRLDVVVLAPAGPRLAHFRQEGALIEADIRLEQWAALDPRWLLQDIRWIFFARCANPARRPKHSCWLARAKLTEVLDPATGDVTERTVDYAGLQERITLSDYADLGGARRPRRIRVDNPAFGYTMDVVVDAFTPLPPQGP